MKKAMNIDEAIVHAREIAENADCDAHTCAYQHDCLVDWLEELKRYRATGLTPEEVAPVIHAHWSLKDQHGNGVCSHCKRQDAIDPLATNCRYCGAKMDGKGDN